MPTTTATASSLIDRLNAEWAGLRVSPYAASRVRLWAGMSPALASCAVLDDVIALLNSDSDAVHHDDVLRALLRYGRDGDHLALRAVFQMFLGAAIRAGLSHVRVAMLTYDEAAQDVADALWETVATYPLERRPVKIAANLKMETVRRLAAQLGDRAPTYAEVPVDPSRSQVFDQTSTDVPVPAAHEDVLEVIAWGVDTGAITRLDAALLVEVYCPAPGEPGGTAVAAAGHRIRPSTVRQRCSRAIRALSSAAAKRM